MGTKHPVQIPLWDIPAARPGREGDSRPGQRTDPPWPAGRSSSFSARIRHTSDRPPAPDGDWLEAVTEGAFKFQLGPPVAFLHRSAEKLSAPERGSLLHILQGQLAFRFGFVVAVVNGNHRFPAHDAAHQLLPAGQLAQNTAEVTCASQHFQIAIKEILDRVTAEMEIVWQSTFCDGFTILF